MNKKIKICETINLLDEAFMLLYYMANCNDLEKIKAGHINSYEADINRYTARFDTIIEIYEYVKANLGISKDCIEYYFKERNSDCSTFASLAFLRNQHKYDWNLEQYEHHVTSITEKERIKHYAKIIDHELAETNPEISTVSELINFIEMSPYDKEAKWDVVKIYNNQKKYYAEVCSILSQVIELLNKYHYQIMELSKDFYQYWSEFSKYNDIVALIQEKIQISWKDSTKGVVIVPQIFFPFSVIISYDNRINHSKDVVYISVLLDKRFELSGKKVTKEDIINFSKILYDKSKMDILEFLSKNSFYGKEIADELNLTTATISYHIKSLLAAGFLKATVKSNKVYYQINKASILSYLEQITKYFAEL